MNPVFQSILDKIQKTDHLSDEEKEALIKTIRDSDKSQTRLQFKLERTEKDRHTLQVMLEESIEDLQKKSRAIEAQNRELEIESSLEKVRTVAMSMRKRDDMLDICRTISQQLESLGIREIRNVQTAIFYQDKGTYVNYEYYRLHDKALVTEVDYTNDEISIEFAAEMIKGSHEVFIRHLEGQQVKDWLNFQKTTNVFIDTNLETATSLTYQWFSLGPVAIGTSTYAPLSENEIELFKRFRNVFELAYRRYLDIEKAEAQAREAQIEAALEKVRSRSLAMHKSDELQELVHALFARLNEFNFELDTAIIIIFTEGSKDTVWWLQNSVNQQYLKIAVDYADNFYLRNLFEAKENKKDLPSGFYSFEQKNELLNYLFDDTDFRFTPPEQKESLLQKECATMSVAIAKNTAIHITRYFNKSFSEKENEILKKFSNVFDQAYTRFLDLQKAEAQAREAQIQLALERVRARTMAMQHSEELMEASNLLLQQVQSLGIPVWACGYNIWEIGEKVCTAWMSVLGGIQPSFRLPLTKHRTFIHMYESRLKGEAFYVEEVSGEELGDHYRYMFSLPDFKEIATKQLQGGSFPLPQSQTHHVFNFKHGNLVFLSAEAMPGSWDIFKRFTDVFEQTYTRFLDLQKAEAQAREAEIQLALERVRARSLAMHHTSELQEVVNVVAEQLQNINIDINGGVFICINDEVDNDIPVWASAGATDYVQKVIVPFVDKPILGRLRNAIKQKNNFLVEEYSKEEKIGFFEHLFNHVPWSSAPQKRRQELLSKEGGYTRSVAIARFTSIAIINHTGKNFSDQDNEILKRFGNVFEQSYVRFLDLQKAEAQAREAQIQLALERVRARTMAMQKSEELRDVVAAIYEQLQRLGFVQEGSCNINIMDVSTGSVDWWMTGFGNQKYPHRYHVEYINHPVHITQLAVWKSGKKYTTIEVAGESKKEFDKLMLSQADFEKISEETKTMIASLDRVIFSMAFMKYGALSWAANPITDEQANILQRFAGVFEQTYTRFLDLQKAEAQAKESQIQLALERVRARTMAMQHSDELKKAAALLFQQVKALGVPAYSCGYNIWEKNEKEFTSWMSTQDGSEINGVPNIPLTEDANFIRYVESKQKGEPFFVLELRGERMEEHYQYLKTIPAFKGYFDYAVNAGFDLPKTQIHHIANFSQGNLLFITLEPCPEFHDVFKRFAAVFEQTYTRFLDLQKAETQARESQIQLALERVRARTMAMQKSDELPETAAILFEQFKSLGQELMQMTIGIVNEAAGVIEFSVTDWSGSGAGVNRAFNLSIEEPTLIKKMYTGWKKNQGSIVVDLTGKELEDWINYRNKMSGVTINSADTSGRRVITSAFFSRGHLSFSTSAPPAIGSIRLLERFAQVFDLTYTRFLDLKKAEAQARESQIELGLERVRARAMAMQKSDELSELVDTVFKELTKLDFALTWCIINIIDETTMSNTVWAANPDINKAPESYHMLFEDYPFHHAMMKGWKERKAKYVYVLEGPEKKIYDEYLFSETEFRKVPEAAQAASRAMEKYVVSFSFSNFGGLQTVGDVPLSDASLDILSRFGKVFDLTYTRFNDLKLAEAQVREAQIEASLEKVRSRSMGMQKSDELKDVIQVVYAQFVHLNIHVEHTGFIMDYKKRDDMHIWLADKHAVPFQVIIPYFDCAHWNSFNEAKEKGKDFFANHLPFEEKNRFYRDLFKLIPGVPEETLEYYFSCPGLAISTVLLDNVGLYIENFSGISYSDEENNTLMRFGKVFQQTYTRFLDLQKAEAQAREAKIEAILEKIRSRTMAMQKSAELTDVAGLLFKQVTDIGIKTWTAGFNVWSEDNNSYVDYITSPNGGFIEPYTVYTDTAEALTDISNARKSGVDFDVQYVEGEKIKKLYLALTRLDEKQYEIMLQDGIRFPSHQYEHFVFGSKVSLMFITYEPVPEAHDIFKRLGKVFEQTYTRFLDLKKAEAQALEVFKRASVDRVRAEIASMRTTNDLERITPLIWNELTTLGVPFIRCGVFIMDDEKQQIETHLSTPDGEAIAAFNLPYNAPGETAQILAHWHQKELYKQHWNEAQFVEFTQNLVQQGAVTSGEKYLTENHPTDLYLHFLPFMQGMLYAGCTTALGDDELQLVQNLADAFATAYARYEDFNKLEVAKQQIEMTLVDLKQAQQQLVQSEKMASLGELTAGIAHEIQNPLNFVNNFSDVNKELLEELKEEADKGNIEEIKAIANDVINNEEKINHHGRRADAIVKNMLQHSRSSGAVKEPTDINKLADEYLRLSYHGLRAKDKSFNADFKTELAQSIAKINIVPQDIGRVLLNLINNAFYATNEKKKTAGENYKPLVSVQTKKINNSIEIAVTDNGNGIPASIKEKIFQPFFTTKPTGQGTGLGLSLSYDIIKTHGGEIKVESKEGEGSVFIIRLTV